MLDQLKSREIDCFSSSYFTCRAYASGHERDSNEGEVKVTSSSRFRNTFELTRSFDLIYQTFITFDLPGIANVTNEGAIYSLSDTVNVDDEVVTIGDVSKCCHYSNGAAAALVENVYISFGSHAIARLSGEMCYIFEELCGRPGKRLGASIHKHSSQEELVKHSQRAQRLYLPLYFWYNGTRGSVSNSLNLINAQFQRACLDFTLRPLVSVIENGAGNNLKFRSKTDDGSCTTKIIESISDSFSSPVRAGGAVDYDATPSDLNRSNVARVTVDVCGITLNDTDRQTFAQRDSLTLMDEVHLINMTGAQSTSGSVEVDITETAKNLVYEIIVGARVKTCEDAATNVGKTADSQNGLMRFDGYYDSSLNMVNEPLATIDLSISGQQRTARGLEAAYYNQITPFQSHSCLPSHSGIYSLPFSLFPEDWTIPDSMANCSKLDSMKLRLTPQKQLEDADMEYMIFCLAYNILVQQKGLKARYFV
jgi:hypothetical protein